MNAPSGTNIPLVIQIGKWRRKIILPTVTKCQDNAFNDPNTVRLPRSMSDRAAGDAAGDVHMPQIALSTGHSDALDCLLRKIGIADSEFTPDSGGGRVHMYVGGAGKSGDQGSAMLASGATFADSYGTLFPNYGKMAGYDMIMLQCEGEQLANEKMPFLGNMKTLRRPRRARLRRPPALGVDPHGPAALAGDGQLDRRRRRPARRP